MHATPILSPSHDEGELDSWVSLQNAPHLAELRAALLVPKHGWMVPQGPPDAIVAIWRSAARGRSPCRVCQCDRADTIERMIVMGAGSLEDIALVHRLRPAELRAHARLHLAPRLAAFGVVTVLGEPWRAAADAAPPHPARPPDAIYTPLSSGGWVSRLKLTAERTARTQTPIAPSVCTTAAQAHGITIAIAAGPEDGLWHVGGWWPGVVPAIVKVPRGVEAQWLGSGEAITFAEIASQVVPPSPPGSWSPAPAPQDGGGGRLLLQSG
jgi:hypothetical protein